MTPILDIQRASYYVCSLGGYSLTEALQLWKVKYRSFEEFSIEVITCEVLKPLGDFARTTWEEIEPLTVQQAFCEPNLEKRRVIFECLGVEKIFKGLEPELLDRKAITKDRIRWDENSQPYNYHFDDTYELYRLDRRKLFGENGGNGNQDAFFAVRCWCTTTAREYWIYVPMIAALGKESRWSRQGDDPDAIRAIAWTIRVDVSHPKRIFRQGDVVIVEESGESETVTPYHLTKEQYINLMYSET